MSDAIVLGTVVVSRKTAADGKLVLPASVAIALESLGEALRVRVGDQPVAARVTHITCAKTCGGADSEHRHWFLQGDAFRTLIVDAAYELTLHEGSVVCTIVSGEGAPSRVGE